MTTRDELLRDAVEALKRIKGECEAGIHYERMLTQQTLPSTATIKFWSVTDIASPTLAKIEAHLKEVEG
jgi:hypothetical protein